MLIPRMPASGNAPSVWLIALGEPLPGDPDHLLRMGLLADDLLQRGYRVVWWTSSFDHLRKRHRCLGIRTVDPRKNYRIILLHGCSYRSNLGFRRAVNHAQVALQFEKLSQGFPQPDIILCSMPTIDFSVTAVRYGIRFKVPVVVDIRDLLPDAMVALASPWIQPIWRIALEPYFRALLYSLRGATGIWAISNDYLAWALRRANRPLREEDSVFPLAPPLLGIMKQDALSLRCDERRRLGFNDKIVVVLFLGTFGRTCDLRTAVNAMQRLYADRGIRIHLLISGDGEQDADLRRMAAGLDTVTFTGWVNKDRLRHLMVAADVGLVCYARQATQSIPNKLVEYMSAGLPIVSCLRGEAEKLLAEHACGLTYRAEDPDSLADCLRRLCMDEPSRVRMGRHSLAFFRQSLSTEVVYPRMAEKLARIITAVSTRQAARSEATAPHL